MEKKILVFEDDFNIADMYKLKLQNSGFKVKVVSVPSDPVGDLKEFGPDLVILDLLLPVANGITVLEQIRHDPDIADIPVIILTNLSDNSFEKQAKDLKVNGFYFKTEETPSDLIRIVNSVLPK